ncbi:MAG: TatD family hydrolase [Myxococcales bacterium]|jgi:TatD DNase family protein|nr:TatD family hydrolase [Myxococcales bacterium]HRC56901.1 TatD family hydrolase [Kofleriaceae bacterium]
MWIDSHAHVDGPEFAADRAEVLARARAAGVSRMIVIGAVGPPDSAQRAVDLASVHDDIFATVGTHPHDVGQMTEDWWAIHERLAVHPRVVAIGETGLDYYYDHAPKAEQQTAFARFLELAHRVGKPVVCHIRDAHDDARRILVEGRAAELGVIIHCFTGTPQDAAAYAALGYYVSFSGIATYKNAEPIRQAVAQVPVNRILIETDCPYLAPVPKRGRRNEPAFLVHTAEVVAQAAGLSLPELSRHTMENTCAVFRLPPLAEASGSPQIGAGAA